MNKKRFIPLPYIFLLILFTNSCAGIRYMTVETQNRPSYLGKYTFFLIVNNVVQQPDEVGHKKTFGKKRIRTVKVSTDRIYLLYRSFNSILSNTISIP